MEDTGKFILNDNGKDIRNDIEEDKKVILP